MELVKTNEKWDRSFNSEGEESGNRLESVQFNIKDDEGNSIGNAYVNQGNGNANLSIYGYSTVEEGVEKLKELLGVSE